MSDLVARIEASLASTEGKVGIVGEWVALLREAADALEALLKERDDNARAFRATMRDGTAKLEAAEARITELDLAFSTASDSADAAEARIETAEKVIGAARQLLKDADREWEVPPQLYEYDRAALRLELEGYDTLTAGRRVIAENADVLERLEGGCDSPEQHSQRHHVAGIEACGIAVGVGTPEHCMTFRHPACDTVFMSYRMAMEHECQQ